MWYRFTTEYYLAIKRNETDYGVYLSGRVYEHKVQHLKKIKRNIVLVHAIPWMILFV
jgi:hypothetical protein